MDLAGVSGRGRWVRTTDLLVPNYEHIVRQGPPTATGTFQFDLRVCSRLSAVAVNFPRLLSELLSGLLVGVSHSGGYP